MDLVMKQIPKDKDGLFEDDGTMHNDLPIVVMSICDGMYPTLEYVDEDNWGDAVADFSKENYKFYFPFYKLTD